MPLVCCTRLIFSKWPNDEKFAVPRQGAPCWLQSGIDLHKRALAIHTPDAAGTLVRLADIPTNRDVNSANRASLPGPHRAVVERPARARFTAARTR